MWYNNFWGYIPLDLTKTSAKKIKALENNFEFQNIFQNFFLAALDAFEYTGLPDTCDSRMLERGFLVRGRAMIAEKDGALLSLAGSPASGWTLYGYPVKAFGWGYNGYNEEFPLYVRGADNSNIIRRDASGYTAAFPRAVMGYDNATAYPYVNYLLTECKRLANIKMAIDVLVDNLKQPMIISCDDTAVNSVREALKLRDDNMPAIVGNGKLPIDGFKVWDTKANPETLAEFKSLYEWHESNLRELFGINSNEQSDKKERLLVDEINVNNQMQAESIEKRLAWRKRFCDDVNTVFGTHIDVNAKSHVDVKQHTDTEEAAEDVDI